MSPSRPTVPNPWSNPWPALGAICLGNGLLMIDLFAINVALPAIGRSLHAGLSAMEWIVMAYMLALGVFPVAMGRFGDLFGRKKTYLTGLFIFTLGSLGCAFAGNIQILIAFRTVQGMGAAIMMPLGLPLVTALFPSEKRGLAIGIWGGVSGLGLIAGPLLGGLLVRGDDWRWIFLFNLPAGLAAIAATWKLVPESRDESALRAVDWPGMILLSGGLFLLVFGFFQVRSGGWFGSTTLLSLVGSAGLLALFVLAQRRARHPLIDPSLFRGPMFVAACASIFLFSAAMFGSQPFTSLLMQNTWGYTPIMAGLAFLPATALVALTMPISGWLGQRLGSRLRLAVLGGSLAVTLASLWLVTMTPESGYLDSLLPAFLLRGLGIGIVISTTSLAAMNAVPPGSLGIASGVFTMARQIGSPWGVAVLGTAYLDYLSTAYSSAVSAVPGLVGAGMNPTAAAALLEAAGRFTPDGPEALLPVLTEWIVGGFVRIAWVTAALSALASIVALRIHGRKEAPSAAPISRSAAETSPANAET